jgi:3-deoxy-D-manno-octulosonic-acid transferase
MKVQNLLYTLGKQCCNIWVTSFWSCGYHFRDNTLDFIAQFKDSTVTIVVVEVHCKISCFNCWMYLSDNIKTQKNIKNLLFSEKIKPSRFWCFDTIGILTKIYSYADIAYVGGGFGNPGVHNVLEPATFGVPIVIGSNYSHLQKQSHWLTWKRVLP